MSGRTVVIYAVKSFLQVTLWALEPVRHLELATTTSAGVGGKGKGEKGPPGFRSFGSVSGSLGPSRSRRKVRC